MLGEISESEIFMPWFALSAMTMFSILPTYCLRSPWRIESISRNFVFRSWNFTGGFQFDFIRWKGFIEKRKQNWFLLNRVRSSELAQFDHARLGDVIIELQATNVNSSSIATFYSNFGHFGTQAYYWSGIEKYRINTNVYAVSLDF